MTLPDGVIRGGLVLDPESGCNQKADIWFVNGVLKAILKPGEKVPENTPVFDANQNVVTPGFIDLHTHLRDPGHEYKETLKSGTQCAVAGGFTSVCAMANTSPVNDSAQTTQYILERAKQTAVCRVYPIGAITKNLDGKELAPIMELKEAGCVAISDDGKTVQNARLMLWGLTWAKTAGLPVTTHSIDAELCAHAAMNDSKQATRWGLKGSPNVAEDIIIARDILLAENTGAHLHIGHLSTKGGLELVRQAKQRSLRVTCEVAPHHFTLSDADMKAYDTNYKMCPPLRDVADVLALKEGFRQGLIDCIATDHAPHGVLEKQIEFDNAAFGILGFETALPLSLRLVAEGYISLLEMVALLTYKPAKIFGLPGGTLKPGAPADIVIFNPQTEWTYLASVSKSQNSPFLGQKLKGKVLTTFVAGVVQYHAQ